ncbi:MAG: pseudouridine-5'-phosphate glycosidase [Pyrinomonadaceae bacterium]
MKIKFSDEVSAALAQNRPVVALESTVIAHGLPYPRSVETAHAMESIVRSAGAVPATIAIFNGEFCVGLDADKIERLATDETIRKISRRDLPIASARRLDCATTVATTAFIAHRAGISVFATGGIGGVHRGYSHDVSADLVELARTPIAVVCSGAKIVLDLEATREWLETFGVTVLGWRCDEMPAFYSRSSGLAIDQRVESAVEVAAVCDARDAAELTNAIVITVPVPEENEIERAEIEQILAAALAAAEKERIAGKAVTPFLLSELSRLSSGRTLESNVALLKNNASVAAEIAAAITAGRCD